MSDYLFGLAMVFVPGAVVYALYYLSMVIGGVAWVLPFVIWGVWVWRSKKAAS